MTEPTPDDQPTDLPPAVLVGGALADQPTPMPTPKLIAGVSTGTLTIGVLWLARQFGLEIPPEVGEALIVLAGGAAAWIKRNRGHLLDCLDDEPGDHATDR